MRVQPYTVGSYLHVLKRGARGSNIVKDEADKWRFLRILFLLNDKHFKSDWHFETAGNGLFSRPASWPAREPIVDILAYTLMPNHFHLVLREIQEGGVSLFMKRLGQSMTNHANEKYEEKGSLWQGAFKSKTIGDDTYFRYVAAYVMVKNTFELYPAGGIKTAKENFGEAWEWAKNYSFSSLGDYAGVRSNSPILSPGQLGELFTTVTFKDYARDMILGGRWKEGIRELE